MDVKEIADRCPFDTLFTKNVPHILERIFLSLDYNSFKECLKVNKALNGLLTSESFQVKAKLMFQKEIESEKKAPVQLWFAARYGHIEEVKRLLSSGMVDVNKVSHQLCCRHAATTPLFEVCRRDKLQVLGGKWKGSRL